MFRPRVFVIASAAGLVLAPAFSFSADDPFASHVRPTEPLTPADEQASFAVPDGFVVELVASEPAIGKPLNLAFDVRGRLWVTSTVEYPYPAPPDRPGRDRLTVHEDTDGDGSFDKVTTFADDLNIPIGVLPYRDGAIVFSIPDLVFLRDTDGDGKADRRERILGPFDTTRDTHGMVNGLTRGLDGWIYACHGFNNQSTVRGTDGHEVTMQSGNTFRFRPDGSRVEHVTHGQVNPFGMALDRSGDLYTADCHTKPISLLLPGGSYPSFGKPHDGLGFVPAVMDHLHGSTAIGGIAFGEATAFPEPYQDSAFGGDVMASRIHRDTLVRKGASVHAEEQPPLVTTSDPWFRPVDLKAGPDGALYVADFYNRIIGHYEVPLDHPGRDRHRGRIWRVSHRNPNSPPSSTPDLTALSPDALVAELASPLLTRAHLAVEALVDHAGRAAALPAAGAAMAADHPQARALALAVLDQLDALGAGQVAAALADPDPLVRTHAARAARGSAQVAAALGDPEPAVRRAASTAAFRSPDAALVRPLLDLVHTSSGDPHLDHSARIALREHLRNERWFAAIAGSSLTPQDTAVLADLAVAVPTEAAAAFLFRHLDAFPKDDVETLTRILKAAARNLDPDGVPALVALVRNQFPGAVGFQRELLDSVRSGLEERGVSDPTPGERGWALDLAQTLLGAGDSGDPGPLPWTSVPHPGTGDPGPCWSLSTRRDASDGEKQVALWSSFPGGESKTGIYRSAAVPLGPEFTFYLAGHDGHPNAAPHQKNLVRLVDPDTGETLATAPPPRNDIAQKVVLDTAAHAGQAAVVELVDGDSGGAYAWLAAGRFSNPALNPTRVPEQRREAAAIAARFGLEELAPRITDLLNGSAHDRETAVALARAIVSFDPDPTRDAVAQTLALTVPFAPAVEAITNGGPAGEPLASAFAVAGPAARLAIASTMVSHLEGAEIMLELVSSQKAPARLLRQPAVAQKLAAHPALAARAESLTAGLPAEDGRIDEAIAAAVMGFRQQGGDAAAGMAVFAAQCAACHKVAGAGGDLAPNLDGIGNRGAERLAEDILAPNRNLDTAFQTTLVTTTDNQTLVGFVRRTDGESLVLADPAGNESTLPKSRVASQQTLPTSLMPPTFTDTLTPDQMRGLLAYLLALR